MKLSLEHHDTTVTIETHSDFIMIAELMQEIRHLLLASGWDSDSIDEYVEAD